MKKIFLFLFIVLCFGFISSCGDDEEPAASTVKKIQSQADAEDVVTKINSVCLSIVPSTGTKALTQSTISQTMNGPSGGSVTISGKFIPPVDPTKNGVQYNLKYVFSAYNNGTLTIDGTLEYSFNTSTDGNSANVTSKLKGTLTLTGEYEETVSFDITVTLDSSGNASESGKITVNETTYTFGKSISTADPINGEQKARTCMELLSDFIQNDIMGDSSISSQVTDTTGNINAVLNGSGGGNVTVSGTYEIQSGGMKQVYSVSAFFNQYTATTSLGDIVINGEIYYDYSSTMTVSKTIIDIIYIGNVIISGACSGQQIYDISVQVNGANIFMNGSIGYIDSDGIIQEISFGDTIY
jgi:hypothetical protein